MSRPDIIAHRGASAHAPEHTLSSFELAVRQGAGCIEHDLQVTKDGVLVCLHDYTLDRTTNVGDLFPHRGERQIDGDGVVRRWNVQDFMLAEVKQLDAGSWFGPEFSGARVLTFDELLDWAKTRVSVLTELKDPDRYTQRGVDILALYDATLRRHGLLTGRTTTALTVQSFHQATVRRAAERFRELVPTVWLIDAVDGALIQDRPRLKAIADFAAGIGPEKSIVGNHPEVVRWAHDAGLRVTPWTFRAATIGPFASVHAEMDQYLVHFGVDAVITDHPDGSG